MADASFNGVARFFGRQSRVHGPFAKPSVQRERLPGIAGFRTYNLGTESVTWNVRGIVSADSLANLEAAVNSAVSLMGGGLYQFVTTGGTVYDGCLLQSYVPEAAPQYFKGTVGGVATEGYLVIINAVVEWAQPNY